MSGGTSAIAIASLAVGAVGAGVSAIGAINAAHAQSEAADYNAKIAAQNQQLANQNATQAGLAGEQQAAMSEQKTRAEVGAIKAASAAGGVDVNSGSAVDVRSSAAELGELNAITIRSNAAKQAYGYETQATGSGNQATLDTLQGSNATTAGEIGAGSTLLGGLGSAGANYAKFLNTNSPMNAGFAVAPGNPDGVS